MKMEKRSFMNKVTSLVLAAAMMLSIVMVMPKDVSAAEFNLSAKGGTISITDEMSSGITGELSYIKYKPSNNGYLQLSFSNATKLYSYAAGKVQLYDASRSKTLSTTMTYDTSSTQKIDKTECYGVQKGKTYYIAVLSAGGVNIKAKFTKVNDKSGKKKSKALNIGRKKNVVGTITAGTTNSHYYKFKFTKKQRVNFSITPYLGDTVVVTLSGPGVHTGTFRIGSAAWGKKYPITTSKAVSAGTYYVQVKPGSKVCTGYYKVSWK